MPSRTTKDQETIAIAGCGAICSTGRGVDTLERAIRHQTSGLALSPRFEDGRFASVLMGAVPDFGHPSAPDDPAFELASEAVLEARVSAQRFLAPLRSERVGLVLSTTKANIEALERQTSGRPCSAAARRHLFPHLLAVDLAQEHGAGGPVQCVSVACISGLVALQQGARLILRGQADAVLVVGVDHLSSFVLAGFTALKGIDPAGCRPFDRHRAGLTPGEAGAAMVLVRAAACPEPAVTIAGWGGSNDANHMTGPSRDGSGLGQAIRGALAMAEISPAEIGYINAHGTGTTYNDAMESAALRGVFGEGCPPVSASKGMLGHTLGAAGVLESIICVLALQTQLLPGTARLQVATPEAPASLVSQPRSAERLRHALKINTGFGGVNGALVLRLVSSDHE